MATIINGDGIVTAEGTSTTQGRLRLGEDTDNGTSYVELQAPASVASNVTFTLPSADGTNGQVLQTNGSGALSFATPASGALVFLSSVTANNSATMSVETTFDSTYDKYLISVTGLVCATDNTELRMLLKIGGTYLTTATYVFFTNLTSSSGSSFSGTNESAVAGGINGVVQSNVGNQGGENVSFNLYISNPASTTLQKLFYFLGAGHTNAGEVRYIQGVGCNTNTAALTGVRFQMDSGNITSGVARLYGIANS